MLLSLGEWSQPMQQLLPPQAIVVGDYQFRVGAQYASGWSWSTPVNVTILTSIVAPTILSVTATPVSANLGNVTLTWGDVVGEIQYRVEWSTNNFATVTGRMVAANTTTFTTPNILGGALPIQGRRAVRERMGVVDTC